MPRFSPRVLVTVALVLVALSVLILSQAGYLRPVEGLALQPLVALQAAIAPRLAALQDLATSPGDVATLLARNAELEADVARLQQEVITLREQAAEVDILAALLNFARSAPQYGYVAARVVGRDASPFLRALWIDAGTNDGVARGMPVVNQSGLVGRVVEVYPNASRVRLITDPGEAVNVRLQASRADGVTSAQPNGELRIDMIDQEVEVSQEELVLTSGLGGNYPAQIPVGQVISVRRRDFEVFQQAVITPSVDFEDLEILLVVTSFAPLEAQLGP
ncbi:MAG: rod shape-determining protein MreC [Anaerolineales bacterium]|nr:rod shape-determining protein MreC [Anaerolineales bacterium]